MTCRVFLAESRLAVQTAYQWRELCKTIPGARWDKKRRVWSYPASPHTAKEILDAFPDGSTQWDEAAAALLVEADRQAKAQAQKEADNLPPIPNMKTVSWPHQRTAFWYVVGLWGKPNGQD